jgi:hypothetical protein
MLPLELMLDGCLEEKGVAVMQGWSAASLLMKIS